MGSTLPSGWFTQDITVKNRTGRTQYGDYTFETTGTVVKARIEVQTQLVRGFSGETLESTHVIYTTTPLIRGSVVYIGSDTAFAIKDGFEPISIIQTFSLGGEEVFYKTTLAQSR